MHLRQSRPHHPNPSDERKKEEQFYYPRGDHVCLIFFAIIRYALADIAKTRRMIAIGLNLEDFFATRMQYSHYVAWMHYLLPRVFQQPVDSGAERLISCSRVRSFELHVRNDYAGSRKYLWYRALVSAEIKVSA